jgi:hypothetical protein
VGVGVACAWAAAGPIIMANSASVKVTSNERSFMDSPLIQVANIRRANRRQSATLVDLHRPSRQLSGKPDE